MSNQTINRDLTQHLIEQFSNCAFRTMDLIPHTGEAVGVVVSACLNTMELALNAYEKNGCPSEIISTYRRELAARIVGEKSGECIVTKDGVQS